MSREWRPSPDHELATGARAREAEAEPWRPSAGKVTRTMRLASQLSAAEVHRRAYGEPGDEVADVLARLDASTGAALPAPLAAELGSALGRDLGDVRVHTDGVAAAAARDLAAEAFAIGADIYFAAGAYQPDSPRGRHLIAHEVAHTAQQRGATRVAGEPVRVSEPHDPSELEADRFADAFVARQPARIVPPTALSLITPVHRRVIARRPDEGADPPGTRPAPDPAKPAPPEMKECKSVKVDVGQIELFPEKTWNKAYTILPATVVPIAKGVVMVDIVPVTYGVEGEYNLSALASGSLGPANLTSSVVYVDCETAEQLGIGQSPVENGGEGNSAESDLDRLNNAGVELWGNADLDFTAKASASVTGGAQLKGYAGIADIFKAGGSGGIGVVGGINLETSLHPRITMRWKQGTATMEQLSMTVKLKGDAFINVFLHAGVYVEMSLPDIPILTDVKNFLNSIPILDWAIPDPGTFSWKSDLWKKTWPLPPKRKEWDLTRTWTIVGSSPSASAESVMNAEAPDFAALVKELESEGTGEIPTSDPGPTDKEASGSAEIGSANASATAQIANARKEVEREQAWNAKAAEVLAQRKAKAASTGGGSPSPSLAGIGGGPEAKLAEHARALTDAAGSVGNLERARGHAASAAGSNLPTRIEAKAALTAVANNADTLGDLVTSGTGKFERPSLAASTDKAAEAAFEARRRRVQLRVDAAADQVLAEATWTEIQQKQCNGCAAIAGYNNDLALHAEHLKTLSACFEPVETGLTDAWTTALGGDYPGASAKLDDVETKVGWIETENRKAKRPPPTWDDSYAAPDGGKLMLRPEFRGVVRETFYPSGYRKNISATDKTKSFVVGGVNYWRFTSPNPSIQPKHPTDKTLWEYDDARERPTNDHVPAIAVHWGSHGNNKGQTGRADAYNGLADGIKLVVIPQALNSSLGSGGVTYTPEVTINFRGR